MCSLTVVGLVANQFNYLGGTMRMVCNALIFTCKTDIGCLSRGSASTWWFFIALATRALFGSEVETFRSRTFWHPGQWQIMIVMSGWPMFFRQEDGQYTVNTRSMFEKTWHCFISLNPKRLGFDMVRCKENTPALLDFLASWILISPWGCEGCGSNWVP